MEGWARGLCHLPAKEVNETIVSRVRIPLLPQERGFITFRLSAKKKSKVLKRSSVGRTTDFGSVGHRFESCRFNQAHDEMSRFADILKNVKQKGLATPCLAVGVAASYRRESWLFDNNGFHE